MSELIIGRNKEKQILEEIISSNKPEFLAIYGRRRVGKTFLIKNFMKDKDAIFFRATGMKDASFRKQIRHVTDEIGNTFYSGARLETKKDWFETFSLLTEAIQQTTGKTNPIILFFDEFPWMATKRSLLLQALDHYWNHVWSDNPRIKLIICGSTSSWIIDKIINNKGGLHNRVTKVMRLEPFNLRDTKAYLENMGVNLNHKHIIQIYMTIGGIPYYLSHIQKGLSASQIIGKLAFSKDSFMIKEFKNLYSSLFKNAEAYIDLIQFIGSQRYGVSLSNIIGKSKYFSKGGRITKRLQELEEAGFIISFIPYQHKRQGTYYRLIDEYTLFYFHWIEAIRGKLKKFDLSESYWETIQKSSAWKTWSGYAFEALCYKHLPQIRKALGISPEAMVDSWRYVPREGTKEQGAQIDLLFDRIDDSITLCEIKYSDELFVVDKNIASLLEKKARVFREHTRTKKQIFWAMISANGLKKTAYSEKLITSLATMDDLFND